MKVDFNTLNIVMFVVSWVVVMALAIYTFMLQISANKAIIRMEKIMDNRLEYLNVMVTRIAMSKNKYPDMDGMMKE